ncbi:MAG: ribosomal protein S18-alanine N-acetyltransferase [Anaerolineales bacterium]
MSTSIVIRPMLLEDLEAVIAIERLSFPLPWSERAYRYELSENAAARLWVAEKEGKVIGMLVLWLILDEAHIATLAVHPDHRQQGIARQLLLRALQAAWEDGARQAFLEVRKSNLAAQHLYQQLGFEINGLRPRYYRDNNEDALLMTLKEDTMQTLLGNSFQESIP